MEGSVIYKCLYNLKNTSNVIKEFIGKSLRLVLIFPVSLVGSTLKALTLKAAVFRCRRLRCRFGVLILYRVSFQLHSPYSLLTLQELPLWGHAPAYLIFIFPGWSFLRWLGGAASPPLSGSLLWPQAGRACDPPTPFIPLLEGQPGRLGWRGQLSAFLRIHLPGTARSVLLAPGLTSDRWG